MKRSAKRPRKASSPPKLRRFKQARSAATYEALVGAARRVFSRHGFDEAIAAQIAEEAGVSVGTFYVYFSDKRELFLEVVRRYLDETLRDVLGRARAQDFASANAQAALGKVIDLLFERFTRQVDLHRVYLAMSLRDPDVDRMRSDFESQGVDMIERLIEAAIPRETIRHPRAAALVLSIAGYETATERAGLRTRFTRRPPDAEVKRALLEMATRYLFPPAPR